MKKEHVDKIYNNDILSKLVDKIHETQADTLEILYFDKKETPVSESKENEVSLELRRHLSTLKNEKISLTAIKVLDLEKYCILQVSNKVISDVYDTIRSMSVKYERKELTTFEKIKQYFNLTVDTNTVKMYNFNNDSMKTCHKIIRRINKENAFQPHNPFIICSSTTLSLLADNPRFLFVNNNNYEPTVIINVGTIDGINVLVDASNKLESNEVLVGCSNSKNIKVDEGGLYLVYSPLVELESFDMIGSTYDKLRTTALDLRYDIAKVGDTSQKYISFKYEYVKAPLYVQCVKKIIRFLSNSIEKYS